VALLGALSAITGVAQAQSAAGPVPQPADDSLSYKGITLYGIVDVGLQYETHGAPFSDYFAGTSADIVQKDSNHSAFGLTSNNLSQSRIGLQGIEPLGVGDWFGIFKVETFFNPSSGDISDALKSLAQNNGRTAATQTTNLDSSIAGELFEQAFVGVSSATFGSLTFGRQNTLLADGVAKYDPNGASQAFSLIGLSGTTAGGGDTEDRRLDDSIKYVEVVGPAHVGLMYKFSQSFGAANTAFQADVGAEYLGVSVDAYYVKVNDAIGAAALSATQVTGLAALGLSSSNSVAGTVSDNTTLGIMALYNLGFVPLKFYAGYERIKFADPTDPLAAGFDDIGGYKLGAVNVQVGPASTYYKNKYLQVAWAGVKYTTLGNLDLTAAWYGYDQDSYATGANSGCYSTVAGNCGGTETVLSVDADYRWSKRFDTYAGVMYSSVSDGLANGYILATAAGQLHLKATDANPTIGFRFRF